MWPPAVFARDFHTASRTDAIGPTESASRLRHPVPRRGKALLEMAADPKRWGARLGFLAVLHKWSQRLAAHPHFLCLVPAADYPTTGSAGSLPARRTFSCRSN